jgi:hypothetical protein
MNDLFVEKLAWFKQNEKPEVVLLIADVPERTKFVIAWTNIKIRRADNLTELVSTSENEIWEWLWQNTIYSRDELIEKIGTSFSDSGLGNKMRPLIGNRILYPDGTVNSYVQRYLREKVVNLFENKPKRSTKKT